MTLGIIEAQRRFELGWPDDALNLLMQTQKNTQTTKEYAQFA
jgi:hypothetical protein